MKNDPLSPSGRPLSLAGDTEHIEPHALGCPFCMRHDLELTLATTDHFYLLADHAPLLEGHLLIVPHGHYACYGAIPADYEDEFTALKRRVASFLTAVYRTPTFFEHGVFRQTVFHAHLHALPFGPVSLGLRQQALASDARPAHSLADVRDWYTERGHYFYLEEAAASHQAIGDHDEHDDHDDQGAIFGDAAIFPPEMGVYRQILGSLLSGGGALRWRLPQERYDQRGPMLQGVARAWQAFVANGG